EFMDGNYIESNDYLFKALNYNKYDKNKIKLLIYNAISKNYLALKDESSSLEYFKKAEDLAREKKYFNTLSKMYRNRASSLLGCKNGMNEAINLTEKAIDLDQDEKNKTENYLLLSKLYMLSDMFELSLDYNLKALKLASENNFLELKTESLISLGTNYYIQEKYTKAISSFKEILDSNQVKNTTNKLIALGYLIDSYGQVKNYENAQKYINIYFDKIKNLPPVKKEKELSWLYLLKAQVELNAGNVEKAKENLKECTKIYNENTAIMYSTMPLWIDKIQLDIDSYSTKHCDTLIKNYETLLCKVIDSGLETDLKNSIINSIINTSKRFKKYDVALKYTDEKMCKIKEQAQVNLNTTIDYVASKFKTEVMEEQMRKLKLRMFIYFLVLLILVILLISIYVKNKRIKSLNNELKNLSLIDPLTGVYNKRFFYMKLNELLNEKAFITFFMIDIDYFKFYNDNYGHMRGDEVLRQIATTLKNVFSKDTVVRYGGEEFCIISKDTKENNIKKLDLLMYEIHKLNIEHYFSPVSDRVTISLGVESGKIVHTNDIEKIIKIADEKLYISKETGRNKYTL
ncbi:MAG: tetratricopeptide repeat-containing diguanylate cyclase, partial [Sarcina sp.]